MVVVLVGLLGACGRDGFDKARYCGAAGVTIGGAVDEAGRPLDEFGPEDKRRSYLRLAELAPSSVRDDWTSVAESFVSGQTPIASERRVTEELLRDCGITVDAL